MILQIADLLAPHELALLCDDLRADEDSFISGKATAGWAAREVKHNDQSSGQAAKAAIAHVREALMDNSVFLAAVRPKEVFGLLVSRYREGMSYGTHADNPLMNGKRTDLSFTVFLNAPEDYEGGELVIDSNDGDHSIKLPAGSVVVYPSTSLHRVTEVTRGQRLVVVGWVRSFIRNAEQREILFDLEQVVTGLRAANAERAILDRIFKTRNNLIRLWAED